MTTETDIEQRLATLYATLAEATEVCPDCSYHGRGTFGAPCDTCKGIGRVARFNGFRQACACVSRGQAQHRCGLCNGTGWQVRAVGSFDAMTAALAGLSRYEAKVALTNVGDWAYWEELSALPDDPMPSAPEILLAGLELVIAVAEREVPDDSVE